MIATYSLTNSKVYNIKIRHMSLITSSKIFHANNRHDDNRYEKENGDEIPKEEKKIAINAFVTADPVAAGKRQEANSRSAVQRR